MSDERIDELSTKRDDVKVISGFRVNEREFLATPVHYSNLPHVSYDGQAVNFSFLTWTQTPGSDPGPRGNLATVVSRVSLPLESARLLMGFLAELGVTPLEEGLEDGHN